MHCSNMHAQIHLKIPNVDNIEVEILKTTFDRGIFFLLLIKNNT